MSHLPLHTVPGTTVSRGAFQQFSGERGCTAMPPTENNEPASGNFILFQRRYRRGESKVSPEEAPRLEADLQRLGDHAEKPKAVARLPPSTGRGTEIREEGELQDKASRAPCEG